MSTEQVDSEQPEEGRQAAAPPPGEILRRAREARGHKREDVAKALRLDPSRIAAIEAGSVPMDTFHRGYMRAYARFLDMDPQAVLTTPADNPDASPESTTSLRSYRLVQQAGTGDRLVRLATGVIILVLIALLGSWVYNNRERLTALVTPSGQSEPGGALPDPPPPTLDYEYPIVQHPAQLPPVGADGPLEPLAPVDEAAEIPPELAAQTDEAGALDGSTITLEPTEEAWVEAYDAEGERAFFGLAKAGSRVPIRGELPIRFIIGNATEVTLRADGEAVDFTAFSNEGVARFLLTAEGPAAASAD